MLASLSDRRRLPWRRAGAAWAPTWGQDSIARIIRDRPVPQWAVTRAGSTPAPSTSRSGWRAPRPHRHTGPDCPPRRRPLTPTARSPLVARGTPRPLPSAGSPVVRTRWQVFGGEAWQCAVSTSYPSGSRVRLVGRPVAHPDSGASPSAVTLATRSRRLVCRPLSEDIGGRIAEPDPLPLESRPFLAKEEGPVMRRILSGWVIAFSAAVVVQARRKIAPAKHPRVVPASSPSITAP